MTVTLLNFQISRDHIASVHRTGCSDIARDKQTHAAITHDYPSLEDALADYVDGRCRTWATHPTT